MAKEEKKEKRQLSPNALKLQRSLTGTGAVAGLWAGGLLGAEHGSLSSAMEGGAQGVEKFAKYRQEDRAHAAKQAHRYVEIEDQYGGKKHLLRDIVEPRPKTQGPPIRERMANLGKGAKNLGKEALIRTKYGIQDAARGTGKWLTRSSLTRSIAIGGAIGSGAGHVLGHYAGKNLDRSQRNYSAQRRRSLQRKRETEIAKEHIRAQAIADAVRKGVSEQVTAQKLSAKLDDLINFDRGSQARALFAIENRLGPGKRTLERAIKERGGAEAKRVADSARATRNLVNIQRKGRAGLDPLAVMRLLKVKGFSSKLDGLIEFEGEDEDETVQKIRDNTKDVIGKVAGPNALESLLKKVKVRGYRLSAKLDDLLHFDDPRPRNALGEYSQQQEGVADPNTMHKTYGTIKQGLSLGGAAAVGGAGALAGSSAAKATGRAVKNLYNKIRESRARG